MIMLDIGLIYSTINYAAKLMVTIDPNENIQRNKNPILSQLRIV